MKRWVSSRVAPAVLMILGMACSSTEQFDRQVWQSAPDHRYYMIDDLISGKRLVGMSKAEVIHALDTTDIKQFSLPGNCWMYIIGKPGWVPATDSPVIVFDVTFRNGRVVTVEKRK